MANIELVIKIPEEIYQHYKRIWQKRRGSIPESCIAFGTPLPKRHGRLGDLDALEKEIENYSKGAFAMTPEFLVKDAPTIIEADTEGSDVYSN